MNEKEIFLFSAESRLAVVYPASYAMGTGVSLQR
jgi:hypothetical protein